MPHGHATSKPDAEGDAHCAARHVTTREAPSLLRADASASWAELSPLFIADRLYDYRLARYCNMLARLAELEAMISRGGVMSSTYPLLGNDGHPSGVREWPQAAEYRALQSLLLTYERDLDLTRA